MISVLTSSKMVISWHIRTFIFLKFNAMMDVDNLTLFDVTDGAVGLGKL